jgi:predicted RND superfamily exporter protein
LLVIAGLIVAILRHAGGVVMTFLVIIACVIAALATSGWLGIEMSSVTFTLPQILIAVCVADAVHLLVGFYRARKSGLPRRDAARHSLQKNLVPTLLTSLTTMLGFFSFATAEMPPLAGLGLLAGIGTVYAWLIAYGVVGPLMVLWPGKDATAGDGGSAAEDTLHHATPRTTAYVALIDRLRLPIVATFIVTSLGMGYLGSLNEINSNPYEYFRKGTPMRDAQDFILDKLDGIASFELVVDSGKEDGIKDPAFMHKVERLEAGIMKMPGMHRAVSLVDVLRQMNRALNGGGDEHYVLPKTTEGIAQELLLYQMGLPQGMDVNDRVTIKYDAMRVTLVSTIIDSTDFVDAGHEIVALGKQLGLNVNVTGKMSLYQGMNGHVVRSFLRSLLLALGLIGMVMLFSFRSIELGGISSIPNIVPLMVGGGALYMISGQLDMGSVMVASVCLGLCVDNTIHILTNFNRHVAEGRSPRDAMAQVLAHAGPAMTTTTIVLVAGFGTLAFGTFIPNVYFGMLTAIILGVGYLTDMVLLPAILLIRADRKAARAAAPVQATSAVNA